MAAEKVTPDDRSLGVPNGVLARAASLLGATGHLGHSASGGTVSGTTNSGCLAVELLTAPRRLEPDWPDPPDPVPVGDGWVHVALVDSDRNGFDELLRSRSWEPEDLAATAQEMRLPVTPYRAVDRSDIPSHRPGAALHSPVPPRPDDLTGSVVVDLSTHWAGPLATALLARSGATVFKIDPGCRPDGFRARPHLYRHLNQDKTIMDLDLRIPADRTRFESLISGADLVVESFSRRVMTNLGYHPDALRRLRPDICTLGIRAFPADRPERNWVSYGPGVHAAAGFGLRGERPWQASLAYPDLLAGLEAFNVGAILLADHDRPTESEVSLFGSIEALSPSDCPRPPGLEDDHG